MPLLLLIFSILVAGPVFAQEGTFKVIVHKDNPSTSLSANEIADFLLKRSTSWPNGIPAEPINLGSKSESRKAFSMAIHKRSVASIMSYWQRQIFAGRSVPPLELATEEEVVAHVASQPGAIGYVSEATPIGDGVAVVSVSDE